MHERVGLFKHVRGYTAAIVVLGAVLLSAAANAAPTATEPLLEKLVEQFGDVAFGHEHGASQEILQRWEAEAAPAIAFFAKPGYELEGYLPAIARHIRRIYELTGMQVGAERQDARQSTLRFAFYPREDFRRVVASGETDAETDEWLATSACITMALVNSKQAGRIQRAAIVIGTDIPEQQRQHCILEELVQVMGLPNDACHYRPSLFCERDRVLAMTRSDEILLRTLYDARLETGMTRRDAMPIVREIIIELLAGGDTDTTRRRPAERPHMTAEARE